MKQPLSQTALFSIVVIALVSIFGTHRLQAIDIAPMTWTPRADWINVKTDLRVSPHAVGDGVTDDTAAIQSALNIINTNQPNLQDKTVYFPAGTYKITATLHLTAYQYNLIGCGLNTIMKWAGPAGKAMLWQDGAGEDCRFVGFVWDGGGTTGTNTSVGASCAYEHYSSTGSYMTGIRHENESFRNFTIQYGTYLTDDYNPNGMPPAAIISGFDPIPLPVGEMTIFNCYFTNCGTAIHNAVDINNSFVWVIDGCEFENNGIGFNGGFGDSYVVENSHFQNSSIVDIQGGYSIHGHRLTSTGSAQFFNGAGSSTLFQDCWVDGWTTTAGAMLFNRAGQMSVFDCTFTHPPVGALGPIWLYEDVSGGQDILLSNNYAPDFPSGSGILHQQVPTNIDWVPAGSMGGNITSATQTFLKSAAIADSTHILDVTSSTYNPTGANPADGHLVVNWAPMIQAAITAAKTANNGSIVYIPGGFYRLNSTLTVSGGNYTIEGEGYATQLCWMGASTGTMMTVPSPQNITIRQLQLAVQDTLPGVSGITETSTGASHAVYDNVIYNAFDTSNPGASWPFLTGQGVVLNGLPAGSSVYIPVLNSPLTVIDCGPAQILSNMAYIGGVNVSGATHPKTGFLGLMVAEGGQNGSQTPSLYNLTINDNQNLLVGDYYSEQAANDISLLRGAGTTSGHVAIEGLKSGPTPTSVTVNVNNYAGRLFYGNALLTGGSSLPPIQITQTGANPIDLMFADDFFDVAGSTPATFTLGTGATLITTLNDYGLAGSTIYGILDSPNPLTTSNLNSLAASLDDFRQLGALNLSIEYGVVNPSGLVAYWKLDETASPCADSSMSGITGTWINSPTFSTTKPTAIPYADAGSMSFNGTNQYLDMGNPSALPSGTHARTICGWGKLNNTTASYTWIAAFGTNTYGNAMFIGMNGTTLYAGGGQGDDLTVPGFWDTNWHFIALTYDGTTAKLYADGVLKTSAAESWNLVPHACNVGRMTDGTQYWNGQIDDVRIYNRALSAAEISHLATGSP